MKKKYSKEVVLVFFFAFLVVILFLVVRKIYWRKRLKEGREETKRLMEESKEYERKQHVKHIEMGIKYHKDCNICKGGWK